VDPLRQNEVLLQRFQRAIEAKMESKGFRRVQEASEADFLLSVHLGMSRGGPGRTAAASVGVGVGWGGWGGWRRRPGWGWYAPNYWDWGWYGPPVWGSVGYVPYPTPRLDGGVVVALLRERASGQVAWRGQYNADVYDAYQMSEGRVRKVVDQLFEQLR